MNGFSGHTAGRCQGWAQHGHLQSAVLSPHTTAPWGPRLRGPALATAVTCHTSFYRVLSSSPAPSPSQGLRPPLPSRRSCSNLTPADCPPSQHASERLLCFPYSWGTLTSVVFHYFYFIRASVQQTECENLEAQREGSF